jgi:hypothetical protein
MRRWVVGIAVLDHTLSHPRAADHKSYRALKAADAGGVATAVSAPANRPAFYPLRSPDKTAETRTNAGRLPDRCCQLATGAWNAPL